LHKSKPSSSDGGSESIAGAQLALRWPLGGTMVLTVAILLLSCTLAEILVRAPGIRARLPVGSYGTASRYLDFHMDRLREFAAREGGVDCIFIGASPVFRGINPAIVAQAYRARTGQSMQCFNFGIRGLDPANAAILGEIITEDFHPALLVLGLDIPNLSGRSSKGIRTAFLASEWIQFRQGRFQVESWLVDHSYAMRLYMLYRNWMRPGFSPQSIADTDRALSRDIQPDGHAAFRFAADDLAEIPDTASEEARYYDLLQDYTIDPRQLQGVEGLLQPEAGLQVVLLEMPVHPTYLRYYERGEQDYQLGLTAAKATAERVGVPFWTTTLKELIPDEGWANRSHLNETGARIFSLWLGQQIGDAVLEGTLTDPASLRAQQGADA
jgi:hypothetical protein